MSDYITPPSILRPGSLVWAYLRDSGGDGQEQSVSQQKAEIVEYCKCYGLVIAHVFADVAKSGGSVIGRDDFNEMIDMSGDIELRPSGLLLWNFARFARDFDDSSYYKALLRKHGIIIHSLTDPIPEGQYGRVIETFIDIANEEKRRQTSRDVKRSLDTLIRQGFSCGGFPPRGYIAEQQVIGTKRDGKQRIASRWVPDPELWDLVKLAWKLRSEGRSYSEIIKATNGKVYKSKNCWPTFFNNKTYLGVGKCGDLEILDHHEAAITKYIWDEVQEQKEASPLYGKSGHPDHPRRKSNPSLLSGISFCVHCGSAIVHHNGHKDHNWPYYVCGKKDRQKELGKCDARRINAKKVESIVLDTVLNRILTGEMFDDLLKEMQSKMEDAESVDREIKEKERSLREVERAIQNLLDLAESFGAGAALERLNQREVEKTNLLSFIKQLKSKREMAKIEISPEALVLVLNVWRAELDKSLKTGNVSEIKNLLKKFVTKVELGFKQASIWYTYPLNDYAPIRVYSGGGI